jgi:hypothetical protein
MNNNMNVYTSQPMFDGDEGQVARESSPTGLHIAHFRFIFSFNGFK